MAGLKQLKSKRESINKTRKVTRAMEAVSAVKMRKSQERALGGRAYASVALRILEDLTGSAEVQSHPLFQRVESGALGLIIITSDKGLAGSLNSSVLKRVSQFIAHTPTENIRCICIGRRGHEFAQSHGLSVIHYEENKSDTVTEDDMRAITQPLLKAHEAGDTQSWHIAYTNFKSTFEQEASLRQVLPFETHVLADIVHGITPEKGAMSKEEAQVYTGTYAIEPSTEEILAYIIPNLLNIYIYHALLETKASEHSARMVAMKNATDKAGELAHELQLKFNKARQAVITREVSEITSGIEAMK